MKDNYSLDGLKEKQELQEKMRKQMEMDLQIAAEMERIWMEKESKGEISFKI